MGIFVLLFIHCFPVIGIKVDTAIAYSSKESDQLKEQLRLNLCVSASAEIASNWEIGVLNPPDALLIYLAFGTDNREFQHFQPHLSSIRTITMDFNTIDC